MVETMNPMDGDSRFDDTRYTDPRYEDRYRSEHDMEYLNEAMPDMHSTGEFRFCAGCGCRIDDRYFLMAADKHWHVHCLQCYDCKLHLDNELTCFVREGNVYCKEDYYRRFSIKCCAKCRHGISANEMVMRARDFVYHVTCFTCFLCNKTLLPGDYFGMRDNMIYCREDYERLMQDEPPQSHGLQPSTSPGVMGGPGLENIPYFPSEPKRTQKGRPRKRKIAAPDTGFRSMGYLTGDPDAPRDGTVGQDGYLTAGQPRQKRVRTSFKHHQLRAMKSYFQLNHNPDAKDLKQLAQKTGLSKRVLQVWFQNARAKYRRHVLKQEQTKGDGSVVADSEFRLSDDEKGDDKTYAELSNNSSSSISDMSSQSINDLPAGMTDFDQQNGGLSELFTNSISAIN